MGADFRAGAPGRPVMANADAACISPATRHTNVWPAPSASDFTTWSDQSTPTYPVSGHSPGQDGDPRVLVLINFAALSAIRVFRIPERRSLSGHLASTTRRPRQPTAPGER